jgi:hypothetical protein
MRDSTLKTCRRVAPYVCGGTLILLGIMGLVIEIGEGAPTLRNFHGYALAGVLVGCGATTCVAAWLQYGGGLWSFSGLLFLAAATYRFALVSEMHMRSRQLVSPTVFFSTTAALCGVGFYCLVWGHIRRHRSPKDSLHSGVAV